MSQDPIPVLNPITNRPGSIPMPVFNKDSCIQLIQNMLAQLPNPVIYFVRQDEPLAGNNIKHIYRFFIVSPQGIYNISGAVTAAFGVVVTDRSQVFAINSLSPEDDLKQFTNSLRNFTKFPNLTLQDLVMSAKDTLELHFSPEIAPFFPVVSLPAPEGRDQNSQDPVELSS
jgi:hypothetical protein